VGRFEQRLLQQTRVIGMYWGFDAARAPLITLVGDAFWNLKDQEGGAIAVAARQIQQCVAGFRAQRRAVGYREAAIPQAFIDNIVKEIESVAIDILVARIVADQFAAMIRRNNDGGAETLRGKRAFARACRTAQYEQRSEWQVDDSRRLVGGCVHCCDDRAPLL